MTTSFDFTLLFWRLSFLLHELFHPPHCCWFFQREENCYLGKDVSFRTPLLEAQVLPSTVHPWLQHCLSYFHTLMTPLSLPYLTFFILTATDLSKCSQHLPRTCHVPPLRLISLKTPGQTLYNPAFLEFQFPLTAPPPDLGLSSPSSLVLNCPWFLFSITFPPKDCKLYSLKTYHSN